MINPRNLLICALTFCSAREVNGQLDVAKQKEDLKQLYETLVSTHPGIDRYTPAAALESWYNALSASIKSPSTYWAFYRHAARLVTEVKCGHTRLKPSQVMSAATVNANKTLGLPVIFIDRKMYTLMEDGSVGEVITINSMPAAEVIRMIFSGLPVDGDAVNARYDFAASNFSDYYTRFVDEQPEQFTILVKDLKGKVVSSQFASGAPRKVSNPLFQSDNAKGPIAYEVKDGAGYLDVNTFSSGAYGSARVSYNDFLNRTFDEIKKSGVTKLIVDIRNNGGGDDQYGATLCSYLLQKQFYYFKTVKEKVGGTFHAVSHPCLSVQESKPNSFVGEVVMLINGRTFSTAADVAAVFKSSKRGVVMGSETGGGYEGNNSGRSQTFTLKHSGLLITIPLWYYENAVDQQSPPHRGVIPDTVVNPTLESLGSGSDLVQAQAMKSFSGMKK